MFSGLTVAPVSSTWMSRLVMPWACPRRIAPRGSDATSARSFARSFAIVQFDLPSDTWGEATDAKVERITAGKFAIEIYRIATELRGSHFDCDLQSHFAVISLRYGYISRSFGFVSKRLCSHSSTEAARSSDT